MQSCKPRDCSLKTTTTKHSYAVHSVVLNFGRLCGRYNYDSTSIRRQFDAVRQLVKGH